MNSSLSNEDKAFYLLARIIARDFANRNGIKKEDAERVTQEEER